MINSVEDLCPVCGAFWGAACRLPKCKAPAWRYRKWKENKDHGISERSSRDETREVLRSSARKHDAAS